MAQTVQIDQVAGKLGREMGHGQLPTGRRTPSKLTGSTGNGAYISGTGFVRVADSV